MKRNVTYSTTSEEETILLGRALGSLLKAGDVVGLEGALGSGKTRFAKGVGTGLGVAEGTVITSPSFALVNDYEGRVRFFHLDLYRLEHVDDILLAGLDEYLYGDGVSVVEWADRCPQALPEWALSVTLTITGETQRRIDFSGVHARAQAVLETLASTFRRTNRL